MVRNANAHRRKALQALFKSGNLDVASSEDASPHQPALEYAPSLARRARIIGNPPVLKTGAFGLAGSSPAPSAITLPFSLRTHSQIGGVRASRDANWRRWTRQTRPLAALFRNAECGLRNTVPVKSGLLVDNSALRIPNSAIDSLSQAQRSITDIVRLPWPTLTRRFGAFSRPCARRESSP